MSVKVDGSHVFGSTTNYRGTVTEFDTITSGSIVPGCDEVFPTPDEDGIWGSFNNVNAGQSNACNYRVHLANADQWNEPEWGQDGDGNYNWMTTPGIMVDALSTFHPIDSQYPMNDDMGYCFHWENTENNIGQIEYINGDSLKRRERYYRPLILDFGTWDRGWYEWQIPRKQRPIIGPALTGDYVWNAGAGNELDNTLMRAVDLTGKTTASIDYWIWYFIEDCCDFGYIQVSSGSAGSWTDLETPWHGYNGTGTGDWEHKTIDLSAYVGGVVYIRFRYTTDDVYNDQGMFVDNITITADSVVIFSDGAETLDPDWFVEGWSRTTGLRGGEPIDISLPSMTGTPVAMKKLNDTQYKVLTRGPNSGTLIHQFHWYDIEINEDDWTASFVDSKLAYQPLGSIEGDFIPEWSTFIDANEEDTLAYVFTENFLVYTYMTEYFDHTIDGDTEQWYFDHYIVTIDIRTGDATEAVFHTPFLKNHVNFPSPQWNADSGFFFNPLRVGAGHAVAARWFGRPGGAFHAIDFQAEIVDCVTGAVSHIEETNVYESESGWLLSSMGDSQSYAPDDQPFSMYPMGNFTGFYCGSGTGWFLSECGAAYYHSGDLYNKLVKCAVHFDLSGSFDVVGHWDVCLDSDYNFIDKDDFPWWLDKDVTYGRWWPTGPMTSGSGGELKTMAIFYTSGSPAYYRAVLAEGDSLDFVADIEVPAGTNYNKLFKAFARHDDLDGTIYIDFYGGFSGNESHYISAIDYTGVVVKPPGVIYAGTETYSDRIRPLAVIGDSFISQQKNSGSYILRVNTINKHVFL